ncbi:hypothetical protein [Lutibacter sp.]
MKTTTTFSILIWINASRAKNNEAEIYARVTGLPSKFGAILLGSPNRHS